MKRRSMLGGLVVAVLTGCTPPPLTGLGLTLTTHDLLLRADGASGPPVTLQLFQNGRGSALYEDAPALPVPFEWTLRGDRFCTDAAPNTPTGATAPLSCARVVQAGDDRLTFTDLTTGRVSVARLVAR